MQLLLALQQLPALQGMPAGANKAEIVAGAIAGEKLRTSAFARAVYLRLQARCIGPIRLRSAAVTGRRRSLAGR